MSDWRERAACRGHPQAWWWFSTDPTAVSLACRVCAACPVAAECLAEALDVGDDDAIRGGLGPVERKAQSR